MAGRVRLCENLTRIERCPSAPRMMGCDGDPGVPCDPILPPVITISRRTCEGAASGDPPGTRSVFLQFPDGPPDPRIGHYHAVGVYREEFQNLRHGPTSGTREVQILAGTYWMDATNQTVIENVPGLIEHFNRGEVLFTVSGEIINYPGRVGGYIGVYATINEGTNQIATIFGDNGVQGFPLFLKPTGDICAPQCRRVNILWDLRDFRLNIWEAGISATAIPCGSSVHAPTNTERFLTITDAPYSFSTTLTSTRASSQFPVYTHTRSVELYFPQPGGIHRMPGWVGQGTSNPCDGNESVRPCYLAEQCGGPAKAWVRKTEATPGSVWRYRNVCYQVTSTESVEVPTLSPLAAGTTPHANCAACLAAPPGSPIPDDPSVEAFMESDPMRHCRGCGD